MKSEMKMLIVFYASLVIGAVLLGWFYFFSPTQQRYSVFVGYMAILTLVLNSRYFIDGPSASIAFFTGVYDVLHNFAADNVTTVSLIPCIEGEACSIFDDGSYPLHPNWAVAFYHRFASEIAIAWRTKLLLCHVGCNTVAFLLMTFQIYFPGQYTIDRSNVDINRRHRVVGRLANIALVVGVTSAIFLALEHDYVEEYGGVWSKYGFLSMAVWVLGTGIKGMVSILQPQKLTLSDIQTHSRWMFRCTGSMWGSFWIFRALELFLGPLLTSYRVLSIQLCMWSSAPLGILVAEVILATAPSWKDGRVSTISTKGIKQS